MKHLNAGTDGRTKHVTYSHHHMNDRKLHIRVAIGYKVVLNRWTCKNGTLQLGSRPRVAYWWKQIQFPKRYFT